MNLKIRIPKWLPLVALFIVSLLFISMIWRTMDSPRPIEVDVTQMKPGAAPLDEVVH